jgi:hypothetical protein
MWISAALSNGTYPMTGCGTYLFSKLTHEFGRLDGIVHVAYAYICPVKLGERIALCRF